jgi:hypothetical protein
VKSKKKQQQQQQLQQQQQQQSTSSTSSRPSIIKYATNTKSTFNATKSIPSQV